MYVCGQTNLLAKLGEYINKKSLPNFIILCGSLGSGRTTVACVTASKFGIRYFICDPTIAGVRDAITKSELDVNTEKIFIFRDLDGMSIAAKNALLKFTEDTPRNSHIIATASNLENVLDTLISRASVHYMSRYSKDDLKEYIIHKKYDMTDSEMDSVLAICTCPGDIDKVSDDFAHIYDLSVKFVDFIGNTQIGNELKISTMLSTKDSDGKIDPVVFMRCVTAVACDKIKNSDNDTFVYFKIIEKTTAYINAISQTGRNKQMLLDNWIIDLHCSVGGDL